MAHNPYGPPPQPAAPAPDAVYGARFGQAVGRFFARYVNFTGRASRSEYLWVVLFNFLVLLVLSLTAGLGESVAPGTGEELGPVGTAVSLLLVLFLLGVLLPSISLQARRLRDAGLSPFLLLLNLIPYLGSLIVFIMCCLPTQQAAPGLGGYTNQYGQPGQYGQSEYGQPGQYGQPQYGQPGEYGQSEYGQPGQHGQTQQGQPGQYGPGAPGAGSEGAGQQPGPTWQQPPADGGPTYR